MNTIPVAYHKWHVVSGPVGGTVTSVDGTVTFCTIPEGGQGSFYAVTTEVVVSDASISVDDCQNFKGASVKLRLLGQLGRGVLYPGFDLKKYALCKTVDEVIAINANYITDLTDDGVWPYPMPEITSFPNMHNSWWYGFFKGSKLKKIKAKYPKCTYAQAMLGSVTTVEEVDLEFPVATHVSTMCENCDALRKVRIIAPKATRFDYNVRTHKANKLVDCELYAPLATNIEYLVTGAGTLEAVRGEFGEKATKLNSAFANCPKLRVFPTNYSKADTASGMFNNCQISGEAAIAVLTSLPTYTDGKPDKHPITMGIHVDHKYDADVNLALKKVDIAYEPTVELPEDVTEGKGWLLTLQWNGTATAQAASTWGLRRNLIYAKVSTMELPDGETKQMLDWGHYVTNWEERGYQAFGSIEEAREYFNLTEI